VTHCGDEQGISLSKKDLDSRANLGCGKVAVTLKVLVEREVVSLACYHNKSHDSEFFQTSWGIRMLTPAELSYFLAL
jgi:hypothetical protein